MVRSEEGEWKSALNDLVRSLTGAFLFGIPFIYTMEMWWIATFLDLWKLLLLLIVTFAINVNLGFLIAAEAQRRRTWAEAIFEAVYNMGIGVAGATALLFLLGRILPSDPRAELLSKIVLETIPLSIGAAVTRKVQREQQRAAAHDEQRAHYAPERLTRWPIILNQIAITTAGALFLSFPLASTAEIQVLALGVKDWREVTLVLFSLLVTYTIIYRITLAPTWSGSPSGSPLPALTDTLMTYAVAYAVSLAALFLFDRIGFGSPLMHVATQAAVLALPATVGGAAGRRLI